MVESVRQKLFAGMKQCYQLFASFDCGRQQVGLIFGCQRSGTTLLCEIFEADFRTAVLREVSVITCRERGKRFRLRPLREVNRIFETIRIPLVIAKPLVESQNARQLLDSIPHAKAIWLFRNFRDVVQSNVALFRNQIGDVSRTLGLGGANWRSEHVSERTQAVLRRFYRPDMSVHDAAALFWWSRNRLYFEQQLDTHPDVLLVRYEDLVFDPARIMRLVYKHLEVDYPSRPITSHVHSTSVGKGRSIVLSDEIESLCEQTQQQLTFAYERALAVV